MRKLCLLFLLLSISFFIYAENIPQPQGWVNDFAGVISQEYKDKLNSLISELEEKTSAEIAVVTVDSISPYDEKDYARLLFDNWKPGKKGKDNGVLVLLAIKERRWRIETGYGVEGILPDGLCGEIGRNYMVPDFKQGRYAEGLYKGVSTIAGIITGDVKPEMAQPSVSKYNISQFSDFFFFLCFIFLFSPLWIAIFILIILICVTLISKELVFVILGIILFIIRLFMFFAKGTRGTSGYGGYGYGSYGGGSWGGGFGGGGFGGGGFGGGGGGGGGAGGGF